jgi:tetratricopeptide (TPR) repeat protein
VDIATLKDEARSLEQQDRHAEALALYRKILAHLEGTSGILRELPLYVKAGDLNLKLGDAKTAIAMYERAAKRYAQYGSGKSVVALCTKVLRVDPSRTYVYLTHARLMIERGHVAEAAKVLAGYSERTKLGKAHEVLQRLADGDDSEVRPVLEMLLEVAGRAESARRRAAEHASEETEPGDVVGASAPRDEGAKPGSVEEPQSERAAQATAEVPEDPQEDTGAEGAGDAVAEPEEEEVVVREPEEEIAKEPEPDAHEVPRWDAAGEASADMSEQPQVSLTGRADEAVAAESGSLSGEEPAVSVEEPTEPEEEPAPEKPVTPVPEYAPWSGAGRMHEQAGPKPITLDVSQTIEPPVKGEDVHKETESTPVDVQPTHTPPVDVRPKHNPVEHLSHTGPRRELTFTTQQPKTSKSVWIWVAVGVVAVAGAGAGLLMTGIIGGGSEAPRSQGVTPGGTDSTAAISGASDTGLSQPQPLDPTPAFGDSLAQAAANLPTPDILLDTLRQISAPDSTAAIQDTSGLLPAGTELAGPVIVIDGLQIRSVTEFSAGGHRVVHVLDSGEPLTLMAVPLVAGTGDTTGMGQVIVRVLPGDSSMGTVRFGAYTINARGRVAIDVLQGLLGRLVVREP